MSPAKKMNPMRGQNCTVLRWPVHLVYLHDRKQKYNPNMTRSTVWQVFWLEAELAADTMEWTMPRGMAFPLLTGGS